MDKPLSQDAVQTEEGDPDGDTEKQGEQRRVDAAQQRTPAAAQGQWSVLRPGVNLNLAVHTWGL